MMKQLPTRWNLPLVVLALATMVGCQGLTSSNKAATTQNNTVPGVVTVAPSSLSFGVVKVGNNQSLPATMTNTGESTLQVTQVTATGNGFSVNGLSLPLNLAAGQKQGFTVVFTPTAAGTVNGNVAIANTGSTPTVNVGLTGGSATAGVLSPSPSSLNFGSVQVGGNQALPETLTNSGGSTITVTQVTPTGSGYSVSGLSLPIVLTAGQTQPFTVNFSPTASGSSNGNLAVVSNASNPSVNVALTGVGLAPGALTSNPSSLSFGNVQVGNQQPLSETVTNTGAVSVSISQATVTGSGFSMSSWAPQLLTPGQHYTFSVTFTPPAAGNYAGSVSIASNASNPNLSVPLSGTGTPLPQGQLAVTPTTLAFGNVIVGTNAQLQGTLTASGASVTVSSDTLTGAAFALSGLPSFPIVIPAGQNVQYTVTFTPPATGAASGSLSFTSSASNSPALQTLTGTGTPPPLHSVSLSWTASNSSGVNGYNIYRGTTSGGPYSKINAVLNASTLYTDSTVSDGQTYYYVTTAVNSSNEESGYSNQTQAVIPPP
jgi:Abnormal spindle-like microcephaly-assoc'd, ASPM-SPD-2-Hydin